MTVQDLKSWTIIREELLRRINDRVWQPGALIPGEADLAEEFGCARTTVNRALRALAETGLVTRKRKAGTRVALNPPHKATFTIPIIREEVEARGAEYSHRVLERSHVALPLSLHGVFRLPANAEVLFLKTVHFADNRPFIYERRYVNPVAVPDLDRLDIARISANEWLVQNAPYSHGEMTFLAANADVDVAEALGAKVGEALFVMERTTWSGLQPITHVHMSYAPGYHLRTQI